MQDEELLIDRVMKRLEIPAALVEKYRPRARKKGEPRTERDFQLDVFLARFNAGQIHDGYPKWSYPRLAKLLEGVATDDLYALYRECSGARKFGALLKWKLANEPKWRKAAAIAA